MLMLAWFISGWVTAVPQRRVAFVLVAPQKTEGMALAILASLFADDSIGVMSLPVVIYHSVQMFVALLVIPRLIKYIKDETEAEGQQREHISTESQR